MKMTDNTSLIDNRLHIRLKRHFIKHGKKIHAHIKKHHKKYIFGWTVYGISHLIILKILAVKLFFLKIVTGGLALVGILHPSLSDIFAKMENICVDNHSIIAAQQTCEKNFATIQDAVTYLESTIDPEMDTLYNAQYYPIIKSLLGNYCEKQINKEQITIETKKINSISKEKDNNEKIRTLEEIHNLWKKKSLENNLSGEKEFCDAKYLAYDMLDLSQSLFLKEIKKQWLLTSTPLLFGYKVITPADKLIIKWFNQRINDSNKANIQYVLDDLWNTTTNDMAHIIKNISVSAVADALDTLHNIKVLSDNEKINIKNKLEIRFMKSCGNNKWYHKINQYYNDNNILQDTKLEEIKLDIPLCDSYQYIDQLDTQVKKILLHELGHFIYYFKDTEPNTFERICRNTTGKTIKSTCNRDEFVSSYAQTNTEEDYAETFSRWALTKIDKDDQYLAYYRSIPKTSNIHMFAGTDTSLIKKFTHFDDLLVTIQKTIK